MLTFFYFKNQFKIYSKQLQTLDLSCIDGTAIHNVWFSQLLMQIGSTIKFLKVSNLSISGEILIEFNETLPCLENLNLSFCKQLSNKGLVRILQLCGSTLISLYVSNTNITKQNFTEYKETLPCLKNLNLSCCKLLSNKGLVQILQCGESTTLRSLNIEWTNITGENLAEINGTLPCSENLNFFLGFLWISLIVFSFLYLLCILYYVLSLILSFLLTFRSVLSWLCPSFLAFPFPPQLFDKTW